jgi:hypothetical protein
MSQADSVCVSALVSRVRWLQPQLSGRCISHHFLADSSSHLSSVAPAMAHRNTWSTLVGRRAGSFCRQASTRSSTDSIYQPSRSHCKNGADIVWIEQQQRVDRGGDRQSPKVREPDGKWVHRCGHTGSDEHLRRSGRSEHSEDQDQYRDARNRTNACRLWRPTIEQGEAERVWDHECDADVHLHVVTGAAETGKTGNGGSHSHTQHLDQRPIGSPVPLCRQEVVQPGTFASAGRDCSCERVPQVRDAIPPGATLIHSLRPSWRTSRYRKQSIT